MQRCTEAGRQRGREAERQGDKFAWAANHLYPSTHTQHPPATCCLLCLCFLLFTVGNNSATEILLFPRMQLAIQFSFSQSYPAQLKRAPRETADSETPNAGRLDLITQPPSLVVSLDQPIALQVGQQLFMTPTSADCSVTRRDTYCSSIGPFRVDLT